MKLFTSLIDYEKVDLVSLSPKRKYSFNLKLQEVIPSWHLADKRETVKTEQERITLSEGSGFTIIGDPVLEYENNTKYFLCECNACKFKILANKTALGLKKLNCINCLNNRLANEALSVNLELIGKSLDGDAKRRNYRFVACNHTRDIATGDVRVGSFSCSECYSKEFEKAVDDSGLENLGKSHSKGTAQYYNIRYKLCGHERLAIQSHLITKTVGDCQVCFEKELSTSVLETYNVAVLEKLTKTNRLIRFNSCGHTRVVGLSNLRAGHIECKVCQLHKFAREAKEAGLTYLKPTSTEENPSRKHLYLAECGHSLTLKPNAVRMGHWTCRICDSGYLDRPNSIYLFEITCGDFTFLKLGYSQKPEYRKYDYKLLKDSSESLLKSVTVKTGREAIILENALHAKYKKSNYKSSDMRKYLTESGFSECYPISLKDELLTELYKLELQKEDNE